MAVVLLSPTLKFFFPYPRTLGYSIVPPWLYFLNANMWPTTSLLLVLSIVDQSKVCSFPYGTRLLRVTTTDGIDRNDRRRITCMAAIKKENKLPPVPETVQPTIGSSSPMTVDEMITDKDVISFMHNGHLLTRGLLPPQLLTDEVIPGLLEVYDDPRNQLKAWKQLLRLHLNIKEPKDDITVAECQQMLNEVEKEFIPCVQLYNLWYQNDNVRTLALSSELGEGMMS